MINFRENKAIESNSLLPVALGQETEKVQKSFILILLVSAAASKSKQKISHPVLLSVLPHKLLVVFCFWNLNKAVSGSSSDSFTGKHIFPLLFVHLLLFVDVQSVEISKQTLVEMLQFCADAK